MSSEVYRLLGLAARAECGPTHHQLLARQAARLDPTGWESLAEEAEWQGVAPLLYTHLKAAGVQVPPAARRELQGLYLRHRRSNEIRTRVLRDALSAFEGAGIPVLLLKGSALSHMVYPEPGLRPMSDVDLLVPGSLAIRAQSVLCELGFSARVPSSMEEVRHKHLPEATLLVDGVEVVFEVHHNLFSRDEPDSLELEELIGASVSFPIGEDGFRANAPGYEDMLWHVCIHVCYLDALYGQSRLIWMADVISVAERFAAEIDWERLRSRHPFVLNTLSLLHFTTPLSDALLERARVEIGRAPGGIGVDFAGWPSSPIAAQRKKGYARFLLDTFFPSEWWLRLHYGLGTTRGISWHRWVRHPLHIVGWVWHLFSRRWGLRK